MKNVKFYILGCIVAMFAASCEQTIMTPTETVQDNLTELQADYDFNEIFGGDDYTQEDIEDFLAEEVIADEFTERMSLSERANSDSCDPEPGEISKFRSALELCTYEYEGSNDQPADDYCSTGRFNTYGTGWMVLRTGRSKDDRSELKLKNSVSFDDPNIMRVELQLEDAPSNSTKGVTLAQIHNRHSTTDRPLARVEFYNGNKLQVVVANANNSNETQSSEEYPLFDYNLRDRLYIKLNIVGDGEEINWFIKNKSTNKQKTKYLKVPDDWKSNSIDDHFYFKTGAYQQVDGGEPRVSICRLTFDLD